MQIFSILAPESADKKWLKEELSPLQKIHKALYVSISHFTMATELRLIASNLYPTDLNLRKNST